MLENEHAFPVLAVSPAGDVYHQEGMSLRDYFAAQALPAIITEVTRGNIGDHPTAGGGPEGFAASAYDIADAMLKARDERN